MRRNAGVSAVFTLLVALSLAVGVGLLSQDRALRAASTAATDPFDVVVTAPGSEVTALFAALYLRPADMGLLDGATMAAVRADERAALAAPVAFGDSVGAAPVVGTTAALLDHLGGLSDGAPWADLHDAVVGADLPHGIGDRLAPAHGMGDAADQGAHDTVLTVTGRLARTGTPWDGAVLVPVESVWDAHGLAAGGAGALGRIDADAPGVPAILVRATSLGAAYAFRAEWQRDGATMAFLPGATLAGLHATMGDVRAAMSVMAATALGLVAVAVLCGLALIARLFRRHLALLAALGAPARFTTAVVWLHAVAHLAAGTALGLALGWAGSGVASRIVSARTGLAVEAAIGRGEMQLAALFLGASALAALLPAWIARPSEPARDLR